MSHADVAMLSPKMDVGSRAKQQPLLMKHFRQAVCQNVRHVLQFGFRLKTEGGMLVSVEMTLPCPAEVKLCSLLYVHVHVQSTSLSLKRTQCCVILPGTFGRHLGQFSIRTLVLNVAFCSLSRICMRHIGEASFVFYTPH